MGEMVRYGILPNPYTPGVLVDFYGNPISSGGSGWPSVDGSGPGNLQAQTNSDDTVGYNFWDQGDGGFTVVTTTSGIAFFPGNLSSVLAPFLVDTIGAITLRASDSEPITLQTNNAPINILSVGGVLTLGLGVVLSSLPTSDPENTGEIWNDGGVVVLSGYAGPTPGDTGWIDATGLLTANWSVTAGGVCQYRKINGVVYVQANITAGGGASNPALTLPAGFLPGHTWMTVAVSPDMTPAVAQSSVLTTGALDLVTASGTTAGPFDVGLAYPADA